MLALMATAATSSLWELVRPLEESDAARNIPLGNTWREPRFALEQMPDLSGKVALVTGASSGIGLAASTELARAGAHVLLGCRNATRGEAAAVTIHAAAPAARVDVLTLDLASSISVAAAAAEVAARHSSLDVLINNGGVPAGGGSPLRRTLDGVEECWAVNHLGHFQLTTLLLPLLSAAPSARIVHVASSAHRFAPKHAEWLSLDWLANGAKSSMIERYAIAKLSQIAFSNELHRRLSADGKSHVHSNSVHPGIVATDFVGANAARNFGSVVGPLVAAAAGLRNRLLAYSVADGALGVLHAAASPMVTSGGGYFVPIGQPWRTAHSLLGTDGFGAELWKFSEAALRADAESAKQMSDTIDDEQQQCEQ